jgi:hypothetical protein
MSKNQKIFVLAVWGLAFAAYAAAYPSFRALEEPVTHKIVVPSTDTKQATQT